MAQGPGGINSRRGRHTGIMSTVGRAPSACHPNLRKRYNIGQSRNRRSGRKRTESLRKSVPSFLCRSDDGSPRLRLVTRYLEGVWCTARCSSNVVRWTDWHDRLMGRTGKTLIPSANARRGSGRIFGCGHRRWCTSYFLIISRLAGRAIIWSGECQKGVGKHRGSTPYSAASTTSIRSRIRLPNVR